MGTSLAVAHPSRRALRALLRVRSVNKLAPMGGPLQWRVMRQLTQHDLTLRSTARAHVNARKRCVSKGGHQSWCCPPFETRPSGAAQGEVMLVERSHDAPLARPQR